MTDIPPLISADAGILVGSNDLVRQVAAVAGAPRLLGWGHLSGGVLLQQPARAAPWLPVGRPLPLLPTGLAACRLSPPRLPR